MSQNLTLFLLPTDEKFDGSNWPLFKITMTEAACGRRLIGYLTGEIKRPEGGDDAGIKAEMPERLTWWGALNLTLDKWLQHDAYVRSMVTLNMINPIGAGVCMDGSAAAAWASLTILHDTKTDLGLIHAEEELGSIKYINGSSIEAHFKALRTAWAKANDQGASINDRRFRAYIISQDMPAVLQANSAVTSATNDSSPWCLAFSTLIDAAAGDKITYADSTASCHFFMNREDFVTYRETDASCRTGATAKGSFGIAGCSKVRK
ncbi:hypothetical protein C0992_005601 [Termitomyces sp. T32_za158]|nr:hypothetical protein C0992_005601 [Termitomyces sp. T32_za158]